MIFTIVVCFQAKNMVTNTSSENTVLVSVGIPVRNGGDTLKLAIQSVINQTYRNIEIIISDNNSSDETEKVCQEFVKHDSRITYYRQEKTITAIANFRFVKNKSNGKYFMWAADDDLRSENFIETLLKGFESYPVASIIFSDAAIFNDYRNYINNSRLVCINIGSQGHFDSCGLSFIEKHIQQRQSICLHIYGLINSQYLSDFPWFDIDYAPDFPLLHWLLCCGDFVYITGTMFYYFQEAKSMEQMALTNSLKPIQVFPLLRFSHVCTKSVIKAESKKRRYFDNIFTYIYLFFFFYLARHGGLIQFIKSTVYRLSPVPLRIFWKKIKKAKFRLALNYKN